MLVPDPSQRPSIFEVLELVSKVAGKPNPYLPSFYFIFCMIVFSFPRFCSHPLTKLPTIITEEIAANKRKQQNSNIVSSQSATPAPEITKSSKSETTATPATTTQSGSSSQKCEASPALAVSAPPSFQSEVAFEANFDASFDTNFPDSHTSSDSQKESPTAQGSPIVQEEKVSSEEKMEKKEKEKNKKEEKKKEKMEASQKSKSESDSVLNSEKPTHSQQSKRQHAPMPLPPLPTEQPKK